MKFSHRYKDKGTESSGLADYFSIGWSKSRKRLSNMRDSILLDLHLNFNLFI